MKFHVSIIKFDIYLEFNKYTLSYIRYFVYLKILS